MRNSHRLWVLFPPLLLLLSCSWSTDFVLSNRSKTITYEVRYALHPSVTPPGKSPCSDPYFGTPAFTDPGRILWWRVAPRWRDLPTSEYSFDPKTCHFRVLVPPRTSLRLTRELTYVGPSPDAVDFPLGELHVKGGDDLLNLTDPKEIQYLFEKRRDTLYEFNLPHS